MSDVHLDDEEMMVEGSSRMGNLSDNRSAIVKLVMNLKLAKTEAQANYVLIGVMIVAFIATFFIISRYLV